MQRARDAAEAWLAALLPGGVPPGRVRAAADALDEVAVLGRMLLRERDASVTPEVPPSHVGVTRGEEPPEPPPDLIPEVENRTPLKSDTGHRRRSRGPLDYSVHPLGLLSETIIARVTGITQSTLSQAAHRAGIPPRASKRTGIDGRWASFYEGWGKERGLAWLDAHGKTPAARQLREQFMAYVATREPETPAEVDEEDALGPHTLAMQSVILPAVRLSKAEIEAGKELIDDFAFMPKTRADCVNGPRPCPYVRCRYHLAVEVKESGSLMLVHGHDDVTELRDTCALDLADRGGMTLEEVAGVLNVTRERARQIELAAFEKLRAADVD